jgi:hypothetical protein
MRGLGSKLLGTTGIASNRLVVDLGVVGTTGIVIGTAGGWVVGIVAESINSNLTLARAMLWGPGAGALFGLLTVGIDRAFY